MVLFYIITNESKIMNTYENTLRYVKLLWKIMIIQINQTVY